MRFLIKSFDKSLEISYNKAYIVINFCIMKSYLITRPEGQDDKLGEFLINNDCKVFYEPLSDVEFLHYKDSDIKKLKKTSVQAILITSYNVSETFLSFNFAKNVKIFAIGEKSVRKIRKSGYGNINLPEKPSALELEKLFLQKNETQEGAVLYFCGNYLTRDLAQSLKRRHFDVKNILSYKVNYREEFSAQFLQLVKGKKLDNILCYSKNNAKCLAKLIKKFKMENYFKSLKLIAISDKVAMELKEDGFDNVEIFDECKLLKKYYAN